MNDLISRQAAIEEIAQNILHDKEGKCSVFGALFVLKNLPTAEKKGKWLPLADGWACCSECEHLERAAGLRWRYCPNCGAKMEESNDT